MNRQPEPESISIAEYRRLVAGKPRKPRQKAVQGVQVPKQKRERYSLPCPAEATHKLIQALGDFFVNPPLKGSWARREEGLTFGLVAVTVYNNDNGFTLMLLKESQWNEWFQEV